MGEGLVEEKESMLDNVGDALMNAFTKVKNPDDRFVNFANEYSIFEDNLGSIEKHYHKKVKATEGTVVQ